MASPNRPSASAGPATESNCLRSLAPKNTAKRRCSDPPGLSSPSENSKEACTTLGSLSSSRTEATQLPQVLISGTNALRKYRSSEAIQPTSPTWANSPLPIPHPRRATATRPLAEDRLALRRSISPLT